MSGSWPWCAMRTFTGGASGLDEGTRRLAPLRFTAHRRVTRSFACPANGPEFFATLRRYVLRIANWNSAVIDQLIEQIYESSFLPDLWPGVLHELATIAGGRGGVIFVANANGILRWSGSERIREDLEVYVGEGWLAKDLRQPRMITSTHAGFLTDADLFSEEELASDSTIQNYYRARGARLDSDHGRASAHGGPRHPDGGAGVRQRSRGAQGDRCARPPASAPRPQRSDVGAPADGASAGRQRRTGPDRPSRAWCSTKMAR